MTRAHTIAFAALAIILITSNVRDSFASDELPPAPAMAADDVAVTGSAASFDKRLPPVIPGEQIEHNGRKTRVWSTSGPVPGNQVPSVPAAPGVGTQQGNGLPPNTGIIVDNRSDDRHDRR